MTPLQTFQYVRPPTSAELAGARASVALIDRVDDAVWVFAVSSGALFYNYLLRWVAVLWLLSRKGAAE